MTTDSKKQTPDTPKTTDLVSQSDKTIRLLQEEIEAFEQDILDIESSVRILESQIHARYSTEIARIRELSLVFKKQKFAKKEKRREQKKRGENYREPSAVKRPERILNHVSSTKTDHDKLERKKLYREAVLQVHPDKNIDDTDENGKRSQELTIQLIDIYQKGEIEELRHIHSHIMSGNAMASFGTNVPDPQALYDYLAKKRDDLCDALEKAKQSRLYEVLTSYDNPQSFIDELSSQFSTRIGQLERRTRTKG